MRIFVYEHVSGGGHAGQPLPAGVLAEGFAMLRCVVADFRAAGHEVTVLLDERLAKVDAPTGANYTMQVLYANEPKKFLQNAAKNYDAFYVIAPETDRILEDFVKTVEGTGKTSLNCESTSIAQVADKAALIEALQKNGAATPKTLALNVHDKSSAIEQKIKDALSYPLIFKPSDGTSCSGISLLKSQTEIDAALAKIKTQSTNPQFLAQEFIQGTPASVSLICNGKKAAAISLNKQQVSLAQPKGESSYLGGCVPLDHPLKQAAFGLAEKVVDAFSGLRGYVGVDVVLGEKEVFVLDVNARLTTSYVGLRQVADFNVVEAIINAAVSGKLPEKTKMRGAACFEKTSTPKPAIGAYRRAIRVNGVVSPPFPLTDSIDAVALIMGYGDNAQDAAAGLEEAKKSLSRITG
ncbi:MAG: ATP-grasp domain-containing protein [Candidatus Bathyarchaeota archaeon]|nr:ATP-grasp domain-containing protein [Candidatus Bathyarchaeota archaeon]